MFTRYNYDDTRYKKYLEEILLFCSSYSIKESLKQIRNIVWSKYHIIKYKNIVIPK